MSLPVPQAKRRRNLQSDRSAKPNRLQSSQEVMHLYGVSPTTFAFGGAR